jgi:hypothetical protein
VAGRHRRLPSPHGKVLADARADDADAFLLRPEARCSRSQSWLQARPWVEQLLPTAEALDSQARAELYLVAAVTAREVGDNVAALAARERLGPLLAGIQDPYLHAVAQLASAWTSAIVGDFDGALREASVSLAELRGQEEPLWTTVALVTLGAVETAVGRHDDALRHLTEMRPWRSGSTTPGSPPPPEFSWVPWPSCGAGPRRLGRCWTRRWT